MLLLGYDLGSSSVKASLVEAGSGTVIASAVSPEAEMAIEARRPGWAEQDPQLWWENAKSATAEIVRNAGKAIQAIRAIGISYQMHGLVVVDEKQNVLRPSILWCDSRAVQIGEDAFAALGPEWCLRCLLNSPGNFTASKLKWVKENEPGIFSRVHKFMLPGDYLAMKLTGEVQTTVSGLSEAMLWDFQAGAAAEPVLSFYGIPRSFIPRVVEPFSVQGELTPSAAGELGLKRGIPVCYRAGDQVNNAFSLNVLHPGEIAATGGTSGVVFGVTGETAFDPKFRVNTFLHVNHTPREPRYGVLACINGAGILNRWVRDQFWPSGGGPAYEEMNAAAARIPAGSQGLLVLPYGNGAERTLENKDPGASIHGLQFNVHGRSHLARAAQEGIVLAMNLGVEIMREMGLKVETVRAAQANLFLSPLFGEIFSAVTGARVEIVRTDGSEGAARGAGVGAGIYKDFPGAMARLKTVRTIEPDGGLRGAYREISRRWEALLSELLNSIAGSP